MARIESQTKFTTEITAEEISRRYLADNGMVAISRPLAEFMAKCDGGVARDFMVYSASKDVYVMSGMAADLIHGLKGLVEHQKD